MKFLFSFLMLFLGSFRPIKCWIQLRSRNYHRGIISRLFSEKRKAERISKWQKQKSLIDNIPLVKPNESQTIGASDAPIIEGIVIERQGDRLLVELEEQYRTASDNDGDLILCSQKASLASVNIVVGDRVLLKRIQGPTSEGVTVGYKDRKNILERPVASNANALQMKQIASNIDQMFIVVSCQPVVPLVSIDRYLVIAELLGLNATVVLNKNDLECSGQYYKNLEHYPSLGYNILRVTKDGEGLPALLAALEARTSIFVGQSGVGKSSLINLILPHANIRTGGLTQKLQMGSHTTSNCRLYHLKFGGDLIDSPGIREFGLWNLAVHDIQNGFKDIHEASQCCKFRNCKHSEEELGCAVRAKFASGEINPMRLKHYFELTA